jgi:rubrerythrin
MGMQQEELNEKGLTNKVEDVVIGKVEVVEAGVEGEHDFIKTLMNASMSDKTVDSTGKIIEGSNQIQNVLEYWTFIRKTGAKTSQDGGKTVAHNCPNCGAPLDIGEAGQCPFCEAKITSASFDWVLDTIGQPSADM